MAYAALISLKYTIEYLSNSHITRSVYEDLESLGYTLKRLDGSSNRSINRSAINALDAEIRKAVCELDDTLQQLYLCRGPLSLLAAEDELFLWKDIDLFLETVRRLKAEYLRELNYPLPVQEEEDDASATDDFRGNMVGLWDQFEEIKNELLDWQSGPQVVSFVGMAGIGKTLLARQIYHHPLIGQHFDFRMWFSVGPQQQVKNVWAEFVALLEGEPKNAYMEANIVKLVGILGKSLRGRGRCLIVLDDIWSPTVCSSLIRLVAAVGNGSRVLLTTRLEEVGKCNGISIHQIRFLNSEESWKLLRKNVFGDESLPAQLEKAGRRIAENCEGLPLLILTVADILCGLEKSEEFWNKVADSKTATFTEAYERISKVLFSSYEYLPQYLKACFLYMGVFPQKFEIPLPKLLHLWIAEDLLEPRSSLVRTRKGVFEPKQSKTSVASTSKVDFMEEMLPTNRFPLPKTVAGPSIFEISPATNKFPLPRREIFKTCRHKAMKPLEGLYLLEPGPSPIRFIKPWQKITLWESRLCLTRELWSPTRELPLPRAMDNSTPKVKTTPKGIAMEYLKKLVSSSLAIVRKQSAKYRIKACKLHSAYWYLCVKEARKNKFFHVLMKLSDGSNGDIENQRRLSVQNNMLFGIKVVYDSIAATLRARSLLCTGPYHEYPVPICLNLSLLKVLDAFAIRLYDFPHEVVKLYELRYLALTHNGKLASSICMLNQLEYLIVRHHHCIEFLRDSTQLPYYMRKKIRHMHQAWTANFLGDSTCSLKYIWEKICDVQEVWGSRLQENPTSFTKYMWMEIWELICDMQEVRRTPFIRENL